MPDHTRLIHQLELRTALPQADKDLIRGLPLRIAQFSAKSDVAREGAAATESCLVLDGVLCRYKGMSDGTRQILSFHFAGDMPDLQSLYLSTMDHSLSAITAARVAFVGHDALRALAAANPNIAEALARHVLVDASIYREWIANNGRRPAASRVAHLLCELYVRERALGINVGGDVLVLQMTQSDLADATGLSIVHVNRVLQKLRQEGLIRSHGSHHTIEDWEGLQRAGDFNIRYLHLRAAPRELGI